MSFRGPKRFGPSRGTVSLVALCFTVVIGISLASYITLSSRAMQLSNRSFQASVSKQLAEVGLEEALRAFNKNLLSGTDTTAALADWTNSGISTDWTLDTTKKRATATMTFPSDKFGQGTTAMVKIRVDNYDAAHLGASWSSGKSYRINDLLGDNGVWYRALSNHTSGTSNRPPDLSYWAEAPIPWAWNAQTSYTLYDIVCYNGSWYRYINTVSSSGNTPGNTTYWTPIPDLSLTWSSGKSYTRGTMLFNSGTWYYCRTNHTSSASITPTNTLYWAPLPTPAGNTWANNTSYSVGHYVYYSGDWYRCKEAHFTFSWWTTIYPTNATYWVLSDPPQISWAFRSGVTYRFNDVVFYSSSGAGTWYRCKVTSTTSVPTTASEWENALSGSNTAANPGPHGWSSSNINYNPGDTVYFSGQWYRCIKAHQSSGSSTPDTTNWTNTPLFSASWDAGRQYGVNDIVAYNGIWYRCKVANNNSNPASNPGNWASASEPTSLWNPNGSYTANTSYVSYGGVWYRCVTSHDTTKSPNDTNYWTAAWSNSWGITTGAPVVYAEAVVKIPNSPDQKTQLRALIAPAPLFPNAAGATGDLTITTGTGTVDSYDSSLGTSYLAQVNNTATNDSAVLAAGGNLAINGTTTVKGYLAASSLPANISTGTTAKDIDSPASPNLAPDRLSRSPYVPQFDILPSGGLSSAFSNNNFPKGMVIATPAGSGNTVNLGTPGATTPSRYYYDGTLKIGSSHAMARLNINGPVILYVNGFLQLESGGIIEITENGSAEIHTSGHIRILGSGILNRTQNPKKLILLTDSTLAADTYLANAINPDFYGVIYAPKITATIGLEIRTGVNLYGAVSAKEITFSSEADLHYDTSLRHATFGGVDQPYAVTEWRELPATEQATMP